MDTPLIPPEAMREILINALIHRDYSFAGTDVGLAIFDVQTSPTAKKSGFMPEFERLATGERKPERPFLERARRRWLR